MEQVMGKMLPQRNYSPTQTSDDITSHDSSLRVANTYYASSCVLIYLDPTDDPLPKFWEGSGFPSIV